MADSKKKNDKELSYKELVAKRESDTFTVPRSTRPVATVPRPEMENTSSTGIRKGWSVARSGSGM